MSKLIGSLVVASALLVAGCGGGSGGASNAPLSASDNAKAQTLSSCLMANSTLEDQNDMREIVSANLGGTSNEAPKTRFALRVVNTAVNQCGVPLSDSSNPYFRRGMEDYMKALAARSI